MVCHFGHDYGSMHLWFQQLLVFWELDVQYVFFLQWTCLTLLTLLNSSQLPNVSIYIYIILGNLSIFCFLFVFFNGAFLSHGPWELPLSQAPRTRSRPEGCVGPSASTGTIWDGPCCCDGNSHSSATSRSMSELVWREISTRSTMNYSRVSCCMWEYVKNI